MYYLIIFGVLAIIIANPEKVSGVMPGLNHEEQAQMRGGLESISRGISDTTNAGLNAFLRRIMNEGKGD